MNSINNLYKRRPEKSTDRSIAQISDRSDGRHRSRATAAGSRSVQSGSPQLELRRYQCCFQQWHSVDPMADERAQERLWNCNAARCTQEAIQTPGNKIRVKLAGDVLPFLRRLLERAPSSGGSVVLALYELTDPELLKLLLQNRDRLRIVLSNTSADKSKKVWDTENASARKQLHTAGVQIQDRMFNNDHIGHNKFAVLLDP